MSATIPVVRYQRHKTLSDNTSPIVTSLKRKPGTTIVFDIRRLAEEIEELGGMSAEDVVHVTKAIVRNMKRKLADGFSVKLDDFGLFHTTFHCKATANAEDCTVKNIDRVNIRFRVDSSLRLVNESVATTKGGANNIIYELESPKKDGNKPSEGGSGSGGDQNENPLG